jgi:flagellar motor switch/type III secretory pathway protein FliN
MALQRVNALLAELTRIEARRINLEAQVQFLQQAEQQALAPEELLRMRNDYINSDPSIQALAQRIADIEIDYVVAQVGKSAEETVLEHKPEVLDALKTHLAKRREEVGKAFDQMAAARQTEAHRRHLLVARTELEQTKAHEKHLRDILGVEDTQTVQLGRTQLDIQDLKFQSDFDQQQYEMVCRRIRELEMERKSPARVSIAYEAEVVSVEDKRGRLMIVAVLCGLCASILLGIARGRLADKSA